MQSPDEKRAQSTERPEKVRHIDWIRLLCIQTWFLWWFVDGTNAACLFDLHVCYVYVLFFVRFAEEAESPNRPRRESSEERRRHSQPNSR